MKRTILAFLVGFAFASMLALNGGNQPVQAQVTAAKSDFVSKFRGHLRDLVTASVNIQADDLEYTANGYSSSLSVNDLTGTNSGLAVADVTTAEGNAIGIANAITKSAGGTIAANTNSTIFKLTAQ